jgi:serine/threonine protein kinase
MDEIFDIFQKKYNFEKRKVLGKGGFGVVREIKMKDKIYAAKLVKKDAKKDTEKGSINETEENNIILFLHNPNIVKIHKIYQETYHNPLTKEKEIYNLIIMEKANLKDLKTFIRYLYNHNSDIINNAFSEIIGDNFLRFFVKQIINGLEILERNELIHFDIEPENILIFLELTLKLSGFGLLREVYKVDKIRIPGGTSGYLSPEYYKTKRRRIQVQKAKKQDYFALGATIFLLKYNEKMIKVKDNKKSNESLENLLNQEYIIDLLPKIIIKIQSNRVCDRDFVNFLCSLIQIAPDDRPSFEEIYRNKWVNKDRKYISEIVNGFRDDEVYLIKELRKSDFLIEKKQEKEKDIIKRKKFVFKSKKQKKINNNNNNISNKVSTEI